MLLLGLCERLDCTNDDVDDVVACVLSSSHIGGRGCGLGLSGDDVNIDCCDYNGPRVSGEKKKGNINCEIRTKELKTRE